MSSINPLAGPVRNRLLGIEKGLQTCFLEREPLIRGLILGAISGQHVFVLGPPGTAKTHILKSFTSCISNARMFDHLMMPHTIPDELFGPIDVSALRDTPSRYDRVTTGTMVDSEIVFLDEVWKGNASCLNSTLGIMNERVFRMAGRAIPASLRMLVAASNEMPQDASLRALYDRFLMRFVVGPTIDVENFKAIVLADKRPNPERISQFAQVTIPELEKARHEANQLTVGPEVVNAVLSIREDARLENITASDRRWAWSMSIVRAHSWLSGYRTVSPASLSVLVDILWDGEKQRKNLNRIVAKYAIDPQGDALRALEDIEAALAITGGLDPDDAAELAERTNAVLVSLERIPTIDRGASWKSAIARVQTVNATLVSAMTRPAANV